MLCLGLGALPRAQGGFSTNIPLPQVPSSATGPNPFTPCCRHAGAPAPCCNGPLFSRGRGNRLPVPSQHQMVPINFVRAQLASVNWKTQTLNILQMKQQQAHCQQHGTGTQPLLHTTPATGGKQAKSCLGIWVGDLLHTFARGRWLCGSPTPSPQGKRLRGQVTQPCRASGLQQGSATSPRRQGGVGGSSTQPRSARAQRPPASFLIGLQAWLQGARELRLKAC